MGKFDTMKYKIGIDEVGRGPLAGPVAVCAFLMKDDSFLENQKEKKLPKLKDSKKLSKKQREVWFEFLKKQKEEGKCDYAVSFVSPENIDKFGIAKCIQKALNESLKKIEEQNCLNFCPCRPQYSGLSGENLDNSVEQSFCKIFLDGGLHAPVEYVNQETIIRGDELHPVISLASIVAKVSRDAIMTKYSKNYPEYGFEKHSGYGTKVHYEAIKKHGQTPIHRRSFIH
jgi:ribonuclease HII